MYKRESLIYTRQEGPTITYLDENDIFVTEIRSHYNIREGIYLPTYNTQYDHRLIIELRGFIKTESIDDIIKKFITNEIITVDIDRFEETVTGYIQSYKIEYNRSRNEAIGIELIIGDAKIEKYGYCASCGKHSIENKIHKKDELFYSKCKYCNNIWYEYDEKN